MLEDPIELGISELEAWDWRARLERLSSDLFLKDQVVSELMSEVERRCERHGIREVRLNLRALKADLGALLEIYRREE